MPLIIGQINQPQHCTYSGKDGKCLDKVRLQTCLQQNLELVFNVEL